MDRSLIVALGVVLAASLPLPSAAAEDDPLRVARRHLQAGDFLLSLEAAEAAARAEPEAPDVLMVKALAYEGLGRVRVADALLRAHNQLSAGRARDAEVERAQERIAPLLADAPPSIPPASEELRDLRPADVVGRGDGGVVAGRCWVARAAAYELLHWRPGLPDSWRVAGDAARCLAESRAAVRAYRRYQELGGADPGVLQVLDTLAGNLASVTVTVAVDDPSIQPKVFLQLPDERLDPLWTDGALRFSDLPVGTPARVTVAGKGLEPTTADIPALGPGQDYPATVAPRTVGLGTVRIAESAPEDLALKLKTLDEVVDASPGSAHVVTAGDVTAVLSGEHGEVEVPLTLPSGGELTFDPTPFAPTLLTVVGLPAGAEVRVFVEGEGDPIEQVHRLPPAVGTLDDETGVRVAPAIPLTGLVGGAATLFVDHRVLGGGNASLALLGGGPNATTFAWSDLPGVSAVAEARADWVATDASLRTQETGWTVARGVGVGLAAGAIGAAAFAVGSQVRRDEVLCYGRYPELGECETGADPGGDYVAEVGRWEDARDVGIGAAVGLGVSGVATLLLQGILGKKAARERATLGEWDPDDVSP